MAADNSPKTLHDAILHYSDLDTCQRTLAEARWPDGVACPHCDSKDVRYLANQRRWECKTKHPRRQFSVKVGTIFEDSPIGLDKWFTAIWLIASAKNGISSYELHRSIGVTQKTAWFMLQRIRLAMQTKSFSQMSGTVEIDETYIGGAARFMHHERKMRYNKPVRKGMAMGKVAVQGLLERHGEKGHSEVRFEMIPNVPTRRALQANVKKHVVAGEHVYSDETPMYTGLKSDYVHKVINHAEAYVDGQVHTNGLENFWCLLKRALKGTYVAVEPFHLFRYLDEQCFRFNSRKQTDAARFGEMLTKLAGKRLTYANLTGEEEGAVGLA